MLFCPKYQSSCSKLAENELNIGHSLHPLLYSKHLTIQCVQLLFYSCTIRQCIWSFFPAVFGLSKKARELYMLRNIYIFAQVSDPHLDHKIRSGLETSCLEAGLGLQKEAACRDHGADMMCGSRIRTLAVWWCGSPRSGRLPCTRTWCWALQTRLTATPTPSPAEEEPC